MKTARVTIPELRRMKSLADAGMPCGSIAIALRVDYGTDRTGDDVRLYLRRHYDWRSMNQRPNQFGSAERSVSR